MYSSLVTKKSAIFAVFLGLFAVSGLYSMEEEPHGIKRPLQEASGIVTKTTEKKAKIDPEQQCNEPTHVSITTAFGQTFQVPFAIASLSPTIVNFIDQIYEDNPQAEDLNISFAGTPLITNELLSQVIKLLEGVYQAQQNGDDVIQIVRALVDSLDLTKNEQQDLVKVIRFFDLQEISNALDYYYLVADNGQQFEMLPEVIYFFPYFNAAFSAGLSETASKEFQTGLSEADVSLLVTLLEKIYPHMKHVSEQLSMLEKAGQSPDQNILKSIKSVTIEMIYVHLNEHLNEQNDVMNLLDKFHQWELFVLEEALLYFLTMHDDLSMLYAFKQELSPYFYTSLFTENNIGEKNVGFLFNWFMEYFVKELITDSAQQSQKDLAKDKEKEKDDQSKESSTPQEFDRSSFEDIAINALTAFRNAIIKNPSMIERIIKESRDALNSFVALHQPIMQKLASMPKIISLLEEIMHALLANRPLQCSQDPENALSATERVLECKRILYTQVGTIGEYERIRPIGALSETRFALLITPDLISQDHGSSIIIFDNNANIKRFPLEFVLSKACVLNENIIILHDEMDRLYTFTLDTGKSEEINTHAKLLGAKDNIYIIQKSNDIEIHNYTTQEVITIIPKTPSCFHAVILPNNRVVVASTSGDLYLIDEEQTLKLLYKKTPSTEESVLGFLERLNPSYSDYVTALIVFNETTVICGYQTGKTIACTIDGEVTILADEDPQIRKMLEMGLRNFPSAISIIIPHHDGKKITAIIPKTGHETNKEAKMQVWDIATQEKIFESAFSFVQPLGLLNNFFIMLDNQKGRLCINSNFSLAEICAALLNKQLRF